MAAMWTEFTKNTLVKNIKFDLPSYLKKIKLPLYRQNK
jgi:hypothetical protein